MVRHRPSLTLEELERAALQLRPIEREILLLSARERLPIDEIAGRLAISREAAERLLADALCRLDRLLVARKRPWWKRWSV
ncbi:MAG TPA: sigma factor-like helix-turn-helix DNA-binding protein [Sphingomicrobium sp.]|nr:sigma factor-like helix-turn-helix DNA-binding protein [Sphingomicrobium sp.]